MAAEKSGLGYLIHDVARLLRRRFDVHAREHGMSLPQWRTIAQLQRAGELSQVSIANLIESDPMTVSRMVERMESLGLVERVVDPRDSRAKLVRLAPAAHAVFEQMKSVGQAVYADALAGLSAAELVMLTDALQRIRNNLNAENPAESETVQ